MKTFEIEIVIRISLLNLIMEGYQNAIVQVEAKTKREAMSVAASYPFFERYAI
jgi:hypothetical protein